MSDDDKRQIVAAARDLIGEFYVHLPYKRAMHAADPLQRLRLLEQRLKRMPPRRFHDEMLSIFADLRDRHTLYYVRTPYRNRIAALPFRVQACVDGVGSKRRRYVVTEVAGDWLPPRPAKCLPFAPGVEITHWNGARIQRAVEQNARWQGGSNRDAQIARSITYLTDRVLTFSPLPDEDWVELRYRDGRRVDEIRMNWRVFSLRGSPDTLNRFARRAGAHGIGIDRIAEGIRRGRKMRFRTGHIELEEKAARGEQLPATFDGKPVSGKPDAIVPSCIVRGDRRYGHLRLWTFDVQNAAAYIEAVLAAIAAIDARDGLIIDVRANGGGNIVAGERLLQLFTPWRIEPERVQFLTTDSTRLIASRRRSNFAEWKKSLLRSVATGEAYSDALPIETDHIESCNSRGQHYHGPVVLIVDALSYSTTDVFAAGFQDNRIGKVLGTDGCTGAGGGNPWSVEYIADSLDGRSWPLPQGTSFDVAVRRNLRVGRRAGVPVEDLGVVPDEEHALTRHDVLCDNEDLMDKAIAMLAAEGPPRGLDVDVRFADGVAHLQIDTAALTELDLYLDGRPVLTVPGVTDGPRAIDLPAAAEHSHELVIYGFADRRALAATRKTTFGTGTRSPRQVEMSPLPIAP